MSQSFDVAKKRRPPSASVQHRHRQREPADQQHHQLQHLRPDHGAQATGDRIDAGDESDDRNTEVHRESQQLVQGQGAKVEHGRNLHEHVGHQDQDREQPARRPAVPALQKLRHRVETVAQVVREKDPQERIETDQDRPPLDGHGHEAVLIGDAHHPDEVVTADVRRDNAAAHHPPRQFLPAEKILASRVVAIP
jgi:hypothetical protein